jgi:hypothetical protein
MRSRKKRTLSATEKRALASAGLVVTRYDAGGERAAVVQLSPESDERKRSFAMRLTDDTPSSEET